MSPVGFMVRSHEGQFRKSKFQKSKSLSFGETPHSVVNYRESASIRHASRHLFVQDFYEANSKFQSSSQLSAVRSSVRQPVKKEWSFTRLRPTPPYQQNNVKTADESSPRAMRRIVSAKKIVGGRGVKDDFDDSAFSRKQSTPSISSTLDSPRQILEEDMMILSVIEAYCFSTRQRQNVSCGSPDSPYLPPDVPPHFSFKPITPPRQTYTGKQKSLKKLKKKPKESDTSVEVTGLKEQVQNLQKQTLYLRENLEEERKSRENFEKFLRKILNRVAPDIDWNEEKLPSKTTNL